MGTGFQLTHGLHRAAALYPTRTAIVDGDRRLTWGEMPKRTAGLAGALARRGAAPGARVAILALNSDRYIQAYYAIAWAGAVSAPINTRWAIREILEALADAEPVFVLMDQAMSVHLDAVRAAGWRIVPMDGPEGFDSLAGEAEIVDVCASGDTLAAIFYTGGTTGRAKGAMLSHANLVSNFLGAQAIAPYAEDEVFLHTPPMFHLADAACVFGMTFLGGTHVVLPGFEPASTLRAISEHKVTALILVPTMINMICEALKVSSADLTSVRRVTYGASPIDGTLLRRAIAAFSNARFVQAYGQTELSPCATVLTHAHHQGERLRSAGQPIIGAELRIVDQDMRDVPAGEVGEVVVRGPGVMLGYWRQPDTTHAAIVGGWLRTGDAGRVDDDGFLYLVDRVKDMIVSGGENVYSVEVENALLSHEGVLQCAVIGVPDERWGERVHAFVVVRPDVVMDEAELLQHCAERIAGYKRPKSFTLQYEPLPMSGVGKVLKHDLRGKFWSGKHRSIG